MTATTPLAKHLRRAGISRAELARRAGISVATVAALLAGRTPQLATARRVGKALNTDPDTLFP